MKNKGMKVCGMCRKEVDVAALLCPHCRSDVNYQFLLSVTKNEVARESHPVRAAVTTVIALILILMAGITGFIFAGFWAGLGFGFIAFVISTSLLQAIFKPQDVYVLQYTCSGCGHQEQFRFDAHTFDDGTPINLVCPSCNSRARLVLKSESNPITSVTEAKKTKTTSYKPVDKADDMGNVDDSLNH